MNNEPNNTPKALFIYKIILAILVLIFISLSVAIAIVCFNKYANSGNNAPEQDSSFNAEATGDKLTLFMNLSKEEAMSAIRTIHEKGFYPEGFFAGSIKPVDDEVDLVILNSYTNQEEVPQIASNNYRMGHKGGIRLGDSSRVPPDSFIIDEKTDFYVVLHTDKSKTNCSNDLAGVICYKGISFNKEYLDIEDGFSFDTTKILNYSESFAKIALPVIASQDSYYTRSLYDYYFYEENNEFVLVLLCIGLGVDTSINTMSENVTSADEIPYALNLYERQLVLDKDTGSMFWRQYDSSYGFEEKTSMHILKSIPITYNEAELLYY